MLNHKFLITLTILFSTTTQLVRAVPGVIRNPLSSTVTTAQASLSSSLSVATSQPTQSSGSILHTWSKDPSCASKACTDDCKTAYTAVCASTPAELSTAETPFTQTVGDCTAFYWFDAGNTIPTSAQCSAAFAEILESSTPGANGCGGAVGGALGYNGAGSRTTDPLYAIYPSDGNANCFKAPGDTSPVVAENTFPNGATFPATCPASTSRMARRRALMELEGRQDSQLDNDDISCIVEDLAWQAGCNAVCLATVTTTAWM